MSLSDKVIEILKSHREYVERINRAENEISKAILDSENKFVILRKITAAVYFAIDMIELLKESFKEHSKIYTFIEDEQEFKALKTNLREILDMKVVLVNSLKKYKTEVLPIEEVAKEVSEELHILRGLIENHVSYERLILHKIRLKEYG